MKELGRRKLPVVGQTSMSVIELYSAVQGTE